MAVTRRHGAIKLLKGITISIIIMPRRAKRTRRTRKRHTKRRTIGSQVRVRGPRPLYDPNQLVIIKSPHIVPDRIRVKLPYADYAYNLGAPAGTNIYQDFKANSIFDPDQTGSGHQPLGRDQLSALYNQYIVHSCSIKAVFYSTLGTGTLGQTIFGVQASNALVAFGPTSAMEQQYTKWNQADLRLSGSREHTLYMKMSTSRIIGRPCIANDDVLSALVSADPTDLWYFRIFAFQADASAGDTDPGTYACVKLVYDVEFFDRLSLSGS